MERCVDLFTRVLSMGWTALPVMGVVLGVRLALRRAPRRYVYLLWAVVAFRLVCPVTITSPVGLISQGARSPALAYRTEAAEPALPAVPEAVPWAPETALPESGGTPADQSPAPAGRGPALLTVLAAVWLAGMGAMAGYILLSLLGLRRLVRTAVRREGKVWECDGLPTPFVLGLIRPRIYIPFHMEEAERTYVLAHEREHLRWGDHWVKALALGILTVYWWHPGVWLCWVLLCRDMELRCDEAVLAALGDGIRQDYSRSLLAFALDRRFPAALAFGEHDAARRIRHVLSWKKARGPVIFLALAAVIMVTAVCGTNAMDRDTSWIRGMPRWRPAPPTGPEYRYQISREYRSYLVYQERYDRGVLTEREALAYGEFGAEEGQVPRRGTFSLSLDMDEVPRENGTSLFRGASWKCTLNGGAEVSFPAVPEGVYGSGGTCWSSRDLERDSPVEVASLTLGEEPYSGTIFFPDEEGFSEWIRDSDITLILRLRLSEEDPETLWNAFETESLETETGEREGDALAARLYSAARTPEAILEVLGAEETLGRYTVEDAPHSYLSMMFYDCPQPLPDRDTTMWKYSMILLALLDDYVETTWNWIDNGVQVRETNGGLWNTREWLNAHGLGKPILEYGKSPEDLRLLLGTLYPQYGGGAEVSAAGIWLAALGGDTAAMVEAIVEPVLGDVSWSLAGDDAPRILELAPESPLSSLHAADGGEGIVSDLSCLLLALLDSDEIWAIRWLDQGAPVEFSYLPGENLFMDNAGYIWTEHRSGNGLYVPACGRSAAGMTLLAEDLGAERFLDLEALKAAAEAKTAEERVTQAAEQIFQDAAEDAPDLLIDDLVCWALWGDRTLSGKFRQTVEQGTLLLEFPTGGGDGDRMDQRMARNAAVLLRLRPDLSAVRWTYPYGDGTAERTFDTGALSSVLPLSSNTAVYRQPQSAQDVQALLRFLSGLNDRVFTAAMEGRDIPRQTPFTDVLGYDGFLWDLQEGVLFSRTWYAVEEGREPFPIAETYGYDPPQSYEVDLDGDGQEELVCNYVTGGDGHPGVHVYQRRGDAVFEGSLSTRDLPGHNNWGLNSTREWYNPEIECFVISYDAGEDGAWEVAFTHREALERMEWYSFTRRPE